MRTVDQAYRAFHYVKFAGLLLSGTTIFFMMAFIVIDVVTRNLMGSSVFGSYEITQYFLMPLAFFPALAYAYGSGIMPKLEMLTNRLKPVMRRNIAILMMGIELVLFSLLTFYGWQYALSGTREQLGFSMKGGIVTYYPILYFIPLGFLLLSIEILFLIIKSFGQKEPVLETKLETTEVEA
ncbi:hypothetical protein AV656_07835 [Bhargavaea cecembensis]|uniref:Tripartite ATP-independent periplasmic transporters DctQ component domain-containing protein n=1 Tax=Bhargavaea cecembensis TaxID=394098 RepID=A0A161SLZ3_9BACL|nr:TRAP transporter small permease [Bhargavaea cecembensis]KZE38803.1 hypothetical protein AV656_07835 [Bhargavaea cecembensis]